VLLPCVDRFARAPAPSALELGFAPFGGAAAALGVASGATANIAGARAAPPFAGFNSRTAPLAIGRAKSINPVIVTSTKPVMPANHARFRCGRDSGGGSLIVKQSRSTSSEVGS